MYKITTSGKTMVGCNHDTWLPNPVIWFENGRQPGQHGAAFTGARRVSNNRITPQSGMNTEGLVFSRLASFYPRQDNPYTDRRKISDEADYLKDILHTCATIKEVKAYIEQYDHSYFIEAVFIYIDKSGEYLIVEPYELIEGNDPNYVLANFCPSITKNEQARKMDRYRHGEDFIKLNKTDASLTYCKALADTMHVSRSRNGDGTLLTSIWDPHDQAVNLYFYHAFDSCRRFDLSEELNKGDHAVVVSSLFPKNPAYERLVTYKTPSNTIEIRLLLVLFFGLLALFTFVLVLAQLLKSKYAISPFLSVSLTLLNSVLMVYIPILMKNKGIFYFDVPYRDPSSALVSATSYAPFLLLLSFGPLLYSVVKSLKSKQIKFWTSVVLVPNLMMYFIMILGFGYWGLFNFWN